MHVNILTWRPNARNTPVAHLNQREREGWLKVQEVLVGVCIGEASQNLIPISLYLHPDEWLHIWLHILGHGELDGEHRVNLARYLEWLPPEAKVALDALIEEYS